MLTRMASRGHIFRAIDRRLQEYNINIETHVAEESSKGTNSGARGPGKVVEGSSTLVGITFRPKNSRHLIDCFRKADRDGAPAFHFHPLSGQHLVKQIFHNLTNADPIQISYIFTKAGMPGKQQQSASGFREIKDLTPPWTTGL